MTRELDTRTLGPVRVLPPTMLTAHRLAQIVRELPVGDHVTIERIGARRLRITKPEAGEGI